MKRSFFVALIVIICFSHVSADSTAGKASIEINLPSRTLSLYKDGLLLKEYPVCVGKKSTPTPQGEYKVKNKTVNPYWINEDVVVPPGPRNPLGIRWIGVIGGIGIHGNNKPNSIGTYASAGCIRMFNRDVEEIYALVDVNTPVTIKYERIKLFDDKYSGGKAAIIYPDSYKKGASNDKKQLEKLRQMNIPEELVKKVQDKLIKPVSKPQAVSDGIGVFLNDSLITCNALEDQGVIYINSKAAADVLGVTSETVERFEIGSMELDGSVYINLTQSVKEFGGSISYDKVSGNAYISMNIIKVNGAFAGLNYGDFDKVDFLAVKGAQKLEYECSEDSAKIRIFDKEIMKLKKKNVLSVNVDNITAALGGYKSICSQYRVVDLKLPTFLRLDNQYFETNSIDGRLMLSAEAAFEIHEKTGWAAEALSLQNRDEAEDIDLDAFLEDYDYTPNIFSTVIDIKLKGN